MSNPILGCLYEIAIGENANYHKKKDFLTPKSEINQLAGNIIRKVNDEKRLNTTHSATDQSSIKEIAQSFRTIKFKDGSEIEIPSLDFDPKIFKSVQGKMKYPSGMIYEGSLINSKRNGNGILTFGNMKYIGSFENDKKHGYGSMFFADGSKYEGMFTNDSRTGDGKMVYQDGTSYVGAFAEGKRHGQGVMTYLDGTKFQGFFANDKKNGNGKYEFTNGSSYECIFMDDLQVGDIKYTFPDGKVQCGTFSSINETLLQRTNKIIKAHL